MFVESIFLLIREPVFFVCFFFMYFSFFFHSKLFFASIARFIIPKLHSNSRCQLALCHQFQLPHPPPKKNTTWKKMVDVNSLDSEMVSQGHLDHLPMKYSLQCHEFGMMST